MAGNACHVVASAKRVSLIQVSGLMRTIFALLVLLAASGAARAAGCPATEQELIGAWNRSGDAGFFEEFLLENASGTRTFASWLHQRPEISGATWSFESCRLIIVPRHGELASIEFKVIGLEQGKLHLSSLADHTESVYVRLPDAP